ncbi:hypothetical protein IW262DRAFT_1464083 [Armillaria fumosa]|nr:hypothetical protein IW262DRAFT_1464083 [Armillaria fumosa]
MSGSISELVGVKKCEVYFIEGRDVYFLAEDCMFRVRQPFFEGESTKVCISDDGDPAPQVHAGNVFEDEAGLLRWTDDDGCIMHVLNWSRCSHKVVCMATAFFTTKKWKGLKKNETQRPLAESTEPQIRQQLCLLLQDGKTVRQSLKPNRPTKQSQYQRRVEMKSAPSRLIDINTPISKKASGAMPFSSLHYSRDVKMVEMAREIHQKCRRIEPQAFLDKFLSARCSNRPEVIPSVFEEIVKKKTEIEMYEPIIHTLAPFCPNLKLVDTHAPPDLESGVFNPDYLKPDISVYRSNQTIDSITQFARMETHVEVKLDANDDAFRDKGVFEHESLLASQYRTHLFTVLICANKARLLRWDRSGVTVTHAFCYASSKSAYLQEFFWRLSNTGAATRGWDISVMDPTAAEDREARLKLHNLKQGERLYKFAVHDDKNPRAKPVYIVGGQPFSKNHASLVGRASRCFIAYHLTEDRVVLLKDSWRIIAPGLIAEGNVLVLGTIGSDLTSFHSSWEMVTAVKCAITAHEQAVTKLRIMHRDISVGNILITRDSRGRVGGILIDWDLSKSSKSPNQGARTLERTGTWQFRSVVLLQDQSVRHNVADDLESFLHVLTWVTLRFTPNDLTQQSLSTTFHRWYEEVERLSGQSLGGRAKQEALLGGTVTVKNLKLRNPNLSRLLLTLFPAFAARYESDFYLGLLETDPEKAQHLLDRLQDHKLILNTVTEALKDRATWPKNDRSQENRMDKKARFVNKAAGEDEEEEEEEEEEESEESE